MGEWMPETRQALQRLRRVVRFYRAERLFSKLDRLMREERQRDPELLYAFMDMNTALSRAWKRYRAETPQHIEQAREP